jgi:radical SAM protein (TIGR01212 family)
MDKEITTPRLYNSLSAHLKDRFGCRVFKVTIDTGLSCPNRDGTKGSGGCYFCVSSALLPKAFTSGADVRGQLLEGIEYVKKRHKAEKFIAYFQLNTNTHGPLGELERIFKEALIPEVACIAVSTRPDCLGDDVLGLLREIKKERPLWVELGLQSANDSTLEKINRGHTAAEFADAVQRAAGIGLDVCAHAIIGLPGEGRADIINTMNFIASLPVWGIKFHQLQVLKGTRLEEAWKRGEVATLSIDEYAVLVAECLELLPPEMVVHRLSGDAPLRYIVAPRWGAGKFKIIDKITGVMMERKTFQGAKYLESHGVRL